MMLFNAPFIPDSAYIDDLIRLDKKLYAVYFSLYQPMVADARIRLQIRDIQDLIEGLKRIPCAAKYLLANGRFQLAENYQFKDGLAKLIRYLEQLMDADILDGIIFSDFYFLNALSMAAPRLSSQLEAMPSINFMIDSTEKFNAVMAMVGQSGFRIPRKMTLDRSLNRRPEALQALAEHIRKHYGGMRIELLANEGCLNHCAFRSTHEALISASNAGISMDTFGFNRDLGCIRTLHKTPHSILASPFIRPEDMDRYSDVADIIKMCGRTLGGAFLRRLVSAYETGQYDGNLFDLLDSTHWMGHHWDLPNNQLPENFLDQLAHCDQNCPSCSCCRDLFKHHARALPVHFEIL